MYWGNFKDQLHRQLQLSDDALHFHAGMAVLLLAALILRRPPWTWRPVLAVAVIEAINEAYDLYSISGDHHYEGRMGDCLHDFVLTLLWPVLIAVTFPYFRRLRDRRSGTL